MASAIKVSLNCNPAHIYKVVPEYFYDDSILRWLFPDEW